MHVKQLEDIKLMQLEHYKKIESNLDAMKEERDILQKQLN